MKKWLLILLMLPALSCVRMEDLSFDGVESVHVESVGGTRNKIMLTVRSSNASGVNVYLKEAELTLKNEDRNILRISVDEQVKLPRKFEGTIQIPVTLRFEGGLLGALGSFGVLSQGLQGTTVSGFIRAKAGWGNKKYEIKEMDTERFLRQFGINPSDLLKELQL